ncbi:unnamed protein product [Schistocephalus solidus]|uniref:C2H2-type domain-containing protein n=1 Tax=Schistocephalus solidus TaxID=70667 RepID=A0A183T5P6_SCHSO|nr:unnamed protein product [Schistocephalus solidus]
MQTHLYATFMDLMKAFDMVMLDGLWKIMQKFGCPERFTHMVRQLHDGMMARVTDKAATNGVKQGCVLAPTIFSVINSAIAWSTNTQQRSPPPLPSLSSPFTHRMGLFGHLRIHDSGIHRKAENTDTPCTHRSYGHCHCSYCAQNSNSRIGLIRQLRIHHRKAGKPVPGSPTHSRRTRLYCPHCFRTFTHRMGLLGHMRLHDNLRKPSEA